MSQYLNCKVDRERFTGCTAGTESNRAKDSAGETVPHVPASTTLNDTKKDSKILIYDVRRGNGCEVDQNEIDHARFTSNLMTNKTSKEMDPFGSEVHKERTARICQTGISTKLRFAVGIDTGCQTPVVKKGSIQDLLLTNRKKCFVELVGFDDSKLEAHESGTLVYFLGSQRVVRKVLMVEGLHEEYLDSLSDVADLIFYKNGHAVGIDNGSTLQLLRTKQGTSLPTVDATVAPGLDSVYNTVRPRSGLSM